MTQAKKGTLLIMLNWLVGKALTSLFRSKDVMILSKFLFKKL